MKVVSRFESRLLRILQCILQRTPLEQTLPLLLGSVPEPPCLSQDAVALVQDYLGKGCVRLLAAHSWQPERFLRGRQIRAGRLWERTPPPELGLSFSRNTLEFLIWLTAHKPGDKSHPWRVRGPELTLGDRLLFFWAYQSFRGSEAGQGLRHQAYFAGDALCRLAFPDDFRKSPAFALDWSPWTTALGTCILEALQIPLTQCLLLAEKRKQLWRDSKRMLAEGKNQEEVLRGFCHAVKAQGRWDLARFLLPVLTRVLADNPGAQRWIGNLNVSGLRLAERVATYRAALVLPRHLEYLQQWQREAQTIGYFEENYAVSQLWKSAWEAHQGDELCRHAAALLREVEPL
jgi:hypothetical protein